MCSGYMLGFCKLRRCGYVHPHITLPGDEFPQELGWDDVCVLPLGALEVPAAMQWRALLCIKVAAAPHMAAVAAGAGGATAQEAVAAGADTATPWQPTQPSSSVSTR